MKKTVFVVEGQTEQVFLLKFIEKLNSLTACHIELQKLHGGVEIKVSKRGPAIDDATHHIRIINAEGDDNVQSYILDRLGEIKAKGFEAVFGLRDRYTGSSSRKPISPESLDAYMEKVSRLEGVRAEITVAIEEIEAWFLLVPEFFQAIHPDLTMEKVAEALGFDLAAQQPDTIPHPAAEIDKVYRGVGLTYRKRIGDSYRIAEALPYETLYLEKRRELAPFDRFVSHIEFALG